MTEISEFEERRKTFISDYEKDRSKYQEFAEYILCIVARTLKDRGIETAHASARAKTVDSMRKNVKKLIQTIRINQNIMIHAIRSWIWQWCVL